MIRLPTDPMRSGLLAASAGSSSPQKHIVEEMNTSEVCSWLAQINCPEEVVKRFEVEGVTGRDIAFMTTEDLEKDLGVSSFLARKIHRERSLLETKPIARTASPNFLNDRYELLKEIGSGGFGKVYSATDHKLKWPFFPFCLRASSSWVQETSCL